MLAGRPAPEEGPRKGRRGRARPEPRALPAPRRLADLLEQQQEELATIEALDAGAVYTLALKTHVGMSIQTFRYFAGWCDKIQVGLPRASGPAGPLRAAQRSHGRSTTRHSFVALRKRRLFAPGSAGGKRVGLGWVLCQGLEGRCRGVTGLGLAGASGEDRALVAPGGRAAAGAPAALSLVLAQPSTPHPSDSAATQ